MSKKIDIMLDMGDKNFADDLIKALGVKPGESINIITPQFERTDGCAVTYRPQSLEEFEAIKKMHPDNLKKIGCGVWDTSDGFTHWLFPYEWYECIPNGMDVVSITGEPQQFERGVTCDDKRFGMLAYGFIQKDSQECRDA
jgi:hypothetical protein